MDPLLRFESLELTVDTVVDAVEVAGLPWCLAVLTQAQDAASQPLYFALAWNEAGRTRISSATSLSVPASLAAWYAASRQQSPGDEPVIGQEMDLAATARDVGLPPVSFVERSTTPALFPLRSRLGSVDGYLLTERAALDAGDRRAQAILGLGRRLVHAIDRSAAGGDAFSVPSSLEPSGSPLGPAGAPSHDFPRDPFDDDQDRGALPLDQVRSIARRIASADTVDSALQCVLQGVRDLTGAESGELCFPVEVDTLSGLQRVYRQLDEGSYRWDEEPFVPHTHVDDSSRTGQIHATAHVDGASSSPRTHDRPGLASAISTPLRAQGRVFGALRAGKTSGEGFQPRDVEVLRILADLAGAAAVQTPVQSKAKSRLHDRNSVQHDGVGGRERLSEAEPLAEGRLAAAFRVTDTVILTFNAAGVIESLAGNAEAITGWKPKELIGNSLLELFPVDSQDEVAKSLQNWEAGHHDPVKTHLSMLHRSGRLVPVHYAAKPHTVAGKYEGGAGTITDLSTVTLLRNELDTARTLQARFQGAVRTGRAVAHDLGSPISTIMALTELLADEPALPLDVVADLSILRREALRASHLLHQFGRISRYAEIATPVGPQLDVGTASETITDDTVSTSQP